MDFPACMTCACKVGVFVAVCMQARMVMVTKGQARVAGVDVNPVSVSETHLALASTVCAHITGQSLRSRDMTVSVWRPEGERRENHLFTNLPSFSGRADHSVPTEKLKAKLSEVQTRKSLEQVKVTGLSN